MYIYMYTFGCCFYSPEEGCCRSSAIELPCKFSLRLSVVRNSRCVDGKCFERSLSTILYRFLFLSSFVLCL